MSLSKSCVVGRDNNVVVVDFTRKPDPPAPRFPGANALRIDSDDLGKDRVFAQGRAEPRFAVCQPSTAIVEL